MIREPNKLAASYVGALSRSWSSGAPPWLSPAEIGILPSRRFLLGSYFCDSIIRPGVGHWTELSIRASSTWLQPGGCFQAVSRYIIHMRSHVLLCAALLAMLTACGKSESPTTTAGAKKTNSSYSSGNPITAPVDYLGAVGQAKKTSTKVVDVSTVQRAVQAFQAGEDRLPANLQEIIKEGYLPKLPAPPYGMKYYYDPRSGQVKIAP